MALFTTDDTKESAPKNVVDTRNGLTRYEMTGTGQYGETVFSVSPDEMNDTTLGSITSVKLVRIPKDTITELPGVTVTGQGTGATLRLWCTGNPFKRYFDITLTKSVDFDTNTIFKDVFGNMYAITKLEVNGDVVEIVNAGTGYVVNDKIMVYGGLELTVTSVDDAGAVTGFDYNQGVYSYNFNIETTGGTGTGFSATIAGIANEVVSMREYPLFSSPVKSELELTTDTSSDKIKINIDLNVPNIEVIDAGIGYDDTTTVEFDGNPDFEAVVTTKQSEENKYITHAGWVRRINKPMPDGSVRVSYETLVASGTNK